MDLNYAELEPPVLAPQPWSERALTSACTALDATVLRAMQIVVDRLLFTSPEEMLELRGTADLLLDEALQREPRRFFAFDDDPPPAVEVRSRPGRTLAGGAVVSRELAMTYRPYTTSPESSEPTELRVPVEHWMHGPREPEATVVALHGFAMGRPRTDALALFASQWFELGLDVALVTLPHHGRRARKARFSGEHFAIPHVGRMAEAVRQAVYEVRGVTGWLGEHTETPLGLLGLSLGGYLAALMAGLYSDLDFVIPMVPPVCLGDMAWRFFTSSRHYREGQPTTFSQAELRAAYRAHSPLAHPPLLPRERLLIVAGRADRIVPPEHPSALWRHWNQPEIHWYNGGHLSPFGRRRIVERVARHLRSLEIL